MGNTISRKLNQTAFFECALKYFQADNNDHEMLLSMMVEHLRPGPPEDGLTLAMGDKIKVYVDINRTYFYFTSENQKAEISQLETLVQDYILYSQQAFIQGQFTSNYPETIFSFLYSSIEAKQERERSSIQYSYITDNSEINSILFYYTKNDKTGALDSFTLIHTTNGLSDAPTVDVFEHTGEKPTCINFATIAPEDDVAGNIADEALFNTMKKVIPEHFPLTFREGTFSLKDEPLSLEQVEIKVPKFLEVLSKLEKNHNTILTTEDKDLIRDNPQLQQVVEILDKIDQLTPDSWNTVKENSTLQEAIIAFDEISPETSYRELRQTLPAFELFASLEEKQPQQNRDENTDKYRLQSAISIVQKKGELNETDWETLKNNEQLQHALIVFDGRFQFDDKAWEQIKHNKTLQERLISLKQFTPEIQYGKVSQFFYTHLWQFEPTTNGKDHLFTAVALLKKNGAFSTKDWEALQQNDNLKHVVIKLSENRQLSSDHWSQLETNQTLQLASIGLNEIDQLTPENWNKLKNNSDLQQAAAALIKTNQLTTDNWDTLKDNDLLQKAIIALTQTGKFESADWTKLSDNPSLAKTILDRTPRIQAIYPYIDQLHNYNGNDDDNTNRRIHSLISASQEAIKHYLLDDINAYNEALDTVNNHITALNGNNNNDWQLKKLFISLVNLLRQLVKGNENADPPDLLFQQYEQTIDNIKNNLSALAAS